MSIKDLHEAYETASSALEELSEGVEDIPLTRRLLQRLLDEISDALQGLTDEECRRALDELTALTQEMGLYPELDED